MEVMFPCICHKQSEQPRSGRVNEKGGAAQEEEGCDVKVGRDRNVFNHLFAFNGVDGYNGGGSVRERLDVWERGRGREMMMMMTI